jgi:hypothetical protein
LWALINGISGYGMFSIFPLRNIIVAPDYKDDIRKAARRYFKEINYVLPSIKRR